MNLVRGSTFGEKLAKALGLDFPIERIVIDCSANSRVIVYVQYPLDSKNTEPIIKCMEEVSLDKPLIVECEGLDVDEKGNVIGTVKRLK